MQTPTFTLRSATPDDAVTIANQRMLMFREIHDISDDVEAALRASLPDLLRGMLESGIYAGWLAEAADCVFLALPHMESQRAVPVLRARGCKVVDLSADYRLRDPQDYVTGYKAPHIDPAGLAEAVYGLPELHRKAIAGASLVASPG